MQENKIYHKVQLTNGQSYHYQQTNPDSKQDVVILLVHGNYSNEGWWNDIIHELRPLNYRIIALDLRGFGKSTYNNPCYKFRDWALDVIDFCKVLQIKKIIINGWSFGGTISQKVAQLAPDLVHKLILTASVSHQGFDSRKEEGKVVEIPRQELENYASTKGILKILELKDKEKVKTLFTNALYSKMESYPEEKKQKLEDSFFEERCYVDFFYAIHNSDIEIDKIKAKTLILHGNEDIVLPLNTILKTAEKLGKLQVWEKGGHMLPLEDTPRYMAAITKFILQ